MARIQGVQHRQAGPIVRLVCMFMRRGMRKLTGREAAHRTGIEPVAHGTGIEPVELRSRLADLSQLRVHRRRTARARLCSGGDEHTVQVTDYLFARRREHFTDVEPVDLTALLMVVNLDGFDAASGVGSAGFSDGMVCVRPDRTRPDRLQSSEA